MGPPRASQALNARGFDGTRNYPYVTNEFIIEDWDSMMNTGSSGVTCRRTKQHFGACAHAILEQPASSVESYYRENCSALPPQATPVHHIRILAAVLDRPVSRLALPSGHAR
jgi:hypothetical protein